METITIYRVEHKEGKGVFQQRDSEGNHIMHKLAKQNSKSILDRHHNFPTPHDEKLDICRNGKEWFCAFKSQNMLNIWFTNKELNALCKIGFSIFKLEVNNYQIGEYQILFTKDSIISKEDITNLLI